jgi:hypothetical protein
LRGGESLQPVQSLRGGGLQSVQPLCSSLQSVQSLRSSLQPLQSLRGRGRGGQPEVRGAAIADGGGVQSLQPVQSV